MQGHNGKKTNIANFISRETITRKFEILNGHMYHFFQITMENLLRGYSNHDAYIVVHAS